MYCNDAKRLIVCMVLFLVSPALADRHIYVDQNHPQASDGNTGTETLPLKTIDRATVIVQPGDHVYIKGSPADCRL